MTMTMKPATCHGRIRFTTSDTGTVLNSGNVAGAGFYVHTFAATGTVAYHCAIHQSSGMVGKVVIQ